MNVPNQDPVSSLVIEHDSIHHQEEYFGYFGIPGGDFYISVSARFESMVAMINNSVRLETLCSELIRFS